MSNDPESQQVEDKLASAVNEFNQTPDEVIPKQIAEVDNSRDHQHSAQPISTNVVNNSDGSATVNIEAIPAVSAYSGAGAHYIPKKSQGATSSSSEDAADEKLAAAVNDFESTPDEPIPRQAPSLSEIRSDIKKNVQEFPVDTEVVQNADGSATVTFGAVPDVEAQGH